MKQFVILFFAALFLYYIAIVFGSPQSFEDRIISLNYDRMFFWGRFYNYYKEKFGELPKNNEKIRQCSCEEYDACVDIASDRNAIEKCHTFCKIELKAIGIKVERYIIALDENHDCSYIIQCRYESNKEFCSKNSTTFIPKSSYSSNFEVSLIMHLLRNNITVNNDGIPINYEESQLHDCTTKCLWKNVKMCFMIKNCDIGLPNGYFLGQPTEITSYSMSGKARITDGYTLEESGLRFSRLYWNYIKNKKISN